MSFLAFSRKNKLDDLTELVSLGRRSFERRFKLATNNTVLEYIQRIKVEAAKRSFENSRKNMNEVMFDVGYTDIKTFRMVFDDDDNIFIAISVIKMAI